MSEYSDSSAPVYHDGRVPLIMRDIEPDEESQARRGWSVAINGELVTDPVSSIHLNNERMGVDARYALHPDGYDTLVLHEANGGGAVTIPYLLNHEDGKIYVGVVEQRRANAGGIVRNVPRGFADPGESHEEAAAREMEEETGLSDILGRLIVLGRGINPNTAFFNTSDYTADGQPEGVAIYGVPVDISEVEQETDQDGSTYYRFKSHIREQGQGDRATEGIVGSRFIPIHDAMHASPDGFTSMAGGYLMAHLMGQKTLRLFGVETPDRN